MASRKTYKQNDRPKIIATVSNGNDIVIDLTSATSPEFHMSADVDATPKVDGVAVIEDGPAGQISYQFVAGDLDTVGDFLAEFQVTLGSQILSIPSDDYIQIEVIKELS